jgi:hypothetical protein
MLFANGPALWAFTVFSGFLIISTVVAVFIWMFRDPDRLQSEEYQLERHKISIIGDDRSRGILGTGQAIMNPVYENLSKE